MIGLISPNYRYKKHEMSERSEVEGEEEEEGDLNK